MLMNNSSVSQKESCRNPKPICCVYLVIFLRHSAIYFSESLTRSISKMCLPTAGQFISRRSLTQLLSRSWRQRKQTVKLREIRKDGGSPLDLSHILAYLAELHISFSPNFMSPGGLIHLSSCYLVLSLLLSSFCLSFFLANSFL